MIPVPAGLRVLLCAAPVDMRKGFHGLAALVQESLKCDPFGGRAFVFRGRRGDLIKVIWWDGQGMCLFSKRLEKAKFVWPATKDGVAVLTPAQLSMLLEGVEWRMIARPAQPERIG